MRSMLAVSAVLAAAAACGSPSKGAPDGATPADSHRMPDAEAPSGPDASFADAPSAVDLSCLGKAPPATAPDPFTVQGTVFAVDHYQLGPIAGATVTLHRRSDDGVIATAATTASDGTYSISVATGGAAIDAYYTIDASGEVSSRIDPGDPITTGYYAFAAVASSDEIARWYADAGVPYAESASPLISVVVDCNHAAIVGATVAVAPAAQVTYYNSVASHWDPGETAGTNGFALVTGGATAESATATWLGNTFPAHAATTPAGTLSLAVSSPHAAAAAN
jgi:hypothetical protein